jgi:hypothetical protein
VDVARAASAGRRDLPLTRLGHHFSTLITLGSLEMGIYKAAPIGNCLVAVLINNRQQGLFSGLLELPNSECFFTQHR